MYLPSFIMAIRKTLTSIVLAGALALGLAGCKEDSSQNQPKQNLFPYTQAGQIAEIPSDYYDGSTGLAAADFDGDGDIDLATVRNLIEGGKVFLYRNDGVDKLIESKK